MLGDIIKAVIEALFGALFTYLRARNADANLKALGYAEAERATAVKNLKDLNAVAAARERAAADSVRSLPDPDARPFDPSAEG